MFNKQKPLSTWKVFYIVLVRNLIIFGVTAGAFALFLTAISNVTLEIQWTVFAWTVFLIFVISWLVAWMNRWSGKW